MTQMKLLRTLMTSVLLMAAFVLMPVQAAEPEPILKSKLFKDFSGNSKSLSDYIGKGKWIVVMIWANDCHACNKEAGGYVALHNKHKKDRAELLGISVDGTNVKAAKSFVKRHGVPFENLIISRAEMDVFLQKYIGKHFIGTPSFMVFSRKGKFEGFQPGAIPASVLDQYLIKNDK
jgi:peroxiredoxin